MDVVAEAVPVKPYALRWIGLPVSLCKPDRIAFLIVPSQWTVVICAEGTTTEFVKRGRAGGVKKDRARASRDTIPEAPETKAVLRVDHIDEQPFLEETVPKKNRHGNKTSGGHRHTQTRIFQSRRRDDRTKTFIDVLRNHDAELLSPAA